jgi:hypothetical protein
MTKFLDAFLSPHSLGSGDAFFHIDNLLRSVHLRVSGASTVYVKLHSRIDVHSIPCVEATVVAENNIYIAGHQSSVFHHRTSL